MVTLRDLTFDILFRDRATKALKRTNKQMDRAKKSTQRLRRSSERLERQQKSLRRTTMGLGSAWKTFAGLAIVGFAANAVKNLGKEMVSLSAKMEMTRVGFEVMLGSRDKAKSLISDIKKFSLATPFTPDQLFQATEQLLAFNFAQDEILPTMKLVGDISKGSSDKFRRLSFALAEVRANSRLMGQEARQMINAGFSPVVEIAKLTGESILEVRKRMEEGRVSFDEVRRAMVAATQKGGKFFQAMSRGALTLTGLQSTLEGFRQEIFIALGDEGLQAFKDLTREMIDLSKETLNWLQVAENAAKVRQLFEDIADGLRLIISLTVKAVKLFERLGFLRDRPLTLRKDIGAEAGGAKGATGSFAKEVQTITPKTLTEAAPRFGGGRTTTVGNLIGSLTVHASGREEGRAAADEIERMLDNHADKLQAQLAQ